MKHRGKIIRMIGLLLGVMLILILSSCESSEGLFLQIKEDFSQFHPRNDVVLYDSHGHIYTNEKDITLLLEHDTDGFIDIVALEIINGEIYVLAYKTMGPPRRWDIALYQCDFQGKNLEKIWERQSIDNRLSTVKGVFVQNTFYVTYVIDDTVTVETVDILSRESTVYFEGAKFDFDTFAKEKTPSDEYFVETQKEDGSFTVLNQSTNVTHTVNQSTFESFGFWDTIQKYNGKAFRHYVVDNRIYLVYRLFIEKDGELFPQGYPLAIFEYDFSTEKLIFQTVLYPYDYEGMRLENNNVLSD